MLGGANVNGSVGSQADGGPGFSTTSDGYIDEVRISDIALQPSQFLNADLVPEPSSIVLSLVGVLGVALFAWRKRRRTSS